MPLPRLSREAVRRIAIDVAVLAAFGLIVALLGPWGSVGLSWPVRLSYWLACMIGGGLIGIFLDETLGRRIAPTWRRVLAITVLMTPPVTVYVLMTAWLIQGEFWGWRALLELSWQVATLCLPIMVLRALVWRAPRVETRTIVEPPLPEAEAAFRRRLSARRRQARLIAIEADDHYLKVHTDAGEELLTLRLRDALADLSRAHGYQVHRSWWVAADAIREVRWRRGSGEVRLEGDLIAPLSRTYAPVLREAGWLG